MFGLGGKERQLTVGPGWLSIQSIHFPEVAFGFFSRVKWRFEEEFHISSLERMHNLTRSIQDQTSRKRDGGAF